MKIVNVSDRPFEFTYDGRNYPIINPGEVVEYDRILAEYAVQKSILRDDEGYPIEQRMKLLSEADPKSIRLVCPLVITGECAAKSFQTLKELSEHIAGHQSAAKARSGLQARDDVKI